ncbi:S-adenosyl-L-methionine-dependent methyltransferase-17 [Botryosphaeria dothidea]|uniref:S-adenosyl-L-methionine-dependent methyltransferase-17 n=1 Tax=Botryosphaeria dothidea TaxID=55169 RepID=A0A8H4NAB1_9PEZI|nr:S-adenosyl-L-methionine-dependent methyltransferase-17 [Botryosphaeria dothidea]
MAAPNDNTGVTEHHSNLESVWTSDASSSLYSLESWNGRRYHSFKDGAYLLPNDDQELDRLDMHHHISLLMLDDKLSMAPINKPQRVLDVGTGTGIWAIDFADANESSFVIGTDLSAVQPRWVPPNLEFQIDDAEDIWSFHDQFDYIHIRSLAGAIGDWKRLFQQAHQHLKPGGWIEVQEHEALYQSETGSKENAPSINEWADNLHAAAEKIGKPFLCLHTLESKIKETGFTNVEQKILKCPHGPWMEDPRKKVVGIYRREHMMEAATSYGIAHFTRVLGWKPEEYQVLASRVRKEMRDESLKLWSKFYIIYAQKPVE